MRTGIARSSAGTKTNPTGSIWKRYIKSILSDFIVSVDEIVDTLVLETGTLGIRISESNRFVVPRSIHDVSLMINDQSFKVHYKKSSFKGKTDFKIEFDDLRIVSDSIGKSIKETDSILRQEIKKLENL